MTAPMPIMQSPGGLASNEPRERHYTPEEFSEALRQYGITLHPVVVRMRCRYPESNAYHIKTNPAFPGRHYIPESELIRIVTTSKHRHE
jgi:hypothetical protein